MKALSNIFIMNPPHRLIMKYAPNFRGTEEIYWYHFVRRKHSQHGFFILLRRVHPWIVFNFDIILKRKQTF